jgi:hypothetical protein
MFHTVFRFVTECWKYVRRSTTAVRKWWRIFLFKRSCKLSGIMREKNTHAIYQIQLYDFKIAVWCVACCRRIIVPVFCQETLNSDRYTRKSCFMKCSRAAFNMTTLLSILHIIQWVLWRVRVAPPINAGSGSDDWIFISSSHYNLS